MALSTQRFQEWADSIRRLFKAEASTATSSLTGPSVAQHGVQSHHGPIEEAALYQNPERPTAALDGSVIRTVEDAEEELTLAERMEKAKQLYPGSKNWAKDEERLFEILYLRQDLPMLPSHWTIDFRGFPIPEDIFETSEEHKPIVYAHSKNGSKDHTGKRIRLILD